MAVQGIDSINQKFELLKRAAQNKVMRSALNAAMTPMVKELRNAAPVGDKAHKSYKGRTLPPGYLRRRGIIKSSRISRDKGRVFGNVRLKDEAWYGSMIEKGWRPGKRSKSVKAASRRDGSLSDSALAGLGDARSKVPGKPWFHPATERSQDKVWAVFRTRMRKKIMEAWRK